MKKGKGNALSFVVLFALPRRMKGADTNRFAHEQGFLVRATRLDGWR